MHYIQSYLSQILFIGGIRIHCYPPVKIITIPQTPYGANVISILSCVNSIHGRKSRGVSSKYNLMTFCVLKCRILFLSHTSLQIKGSFCFRIKDFNYLPSIGPFY